MKWSRGESPLLLCSTFAEQTDKRGEEEKKERSGGAEDVGIFDEGDEKERERERESQGF